MLNNQSRHIVYCDFVDFWREFNKSKFLNVINKIMENSPYIFEIDEINPQLIFCSVFNATKYNYSCPSITFIGENILNNKRMFDNAFNSTYLVGEYEKQHNAFNINFDLIGCANLITSKDMFYINDKLNRKFCSFVVSNYYATDRIDLFNKMNAYKHVDSAGTVYNNITIGNTIYDKIQFLTNYKFNICFENSYNNKYYITEKLRDALLGNTLPIYKGGDIELTNFVNKKCVINCNGKSNEYVVDLVKEIDNNDDMYLEYFKEDKFIINNYFEDKYNQLKEFLIHICDDIAV